MRKCSTQAYYNYAKRMLEGEVALASTEEIDPDLKSLYEAVDGLESKKPGFAEKFMQIVQTKYGIKSTDDLKNNMSIWLKISIGGLSIAGFAIAVTTAIRNSVLLFGSMLKAGGWGSESFKISAIGIACIMASFVFYRMFKYILNSSIKTESTINKQHYELKIISETEHFLNEMNQLIESDSTSSATTFNITAKRSEGICKKMFNWIKEKVIAGWQWIKKHPYITIAFLIVIGCVFYYISALRGQISTLKSQNLTLNKNVRDLSSANNDITNKLSAVSNDLLNANQREISRFYDTASNMVNPPRIKKLLKSGKLYSTLEKDIEQILDPDSGFGYLNVSKENMLAGLYKHIKDMNQIDPGIRDTMLSTMKQKIGSAMFGKIAKIVNTIYN